MSGRDGDGRARNDRHRLDSLRTHEQDERPLGTPWLPLRRAQRVRSPSLVEPISRVELPVLARMFAKRRVPSASSGSEVADPLDPSGPPVKKAALDTPAARLSESLYGGPRRRTRSANAGTCGRSVEAGPRPTTVTSPVG